MKWQRARVLKAHGENNPILNALIWVRPFNGRIPSIAIDAFTNRDYYPPPRAYETNFDSAKGLMLVDAACVELLARDETDFADDVPLSTWEDFCRAAKEKLA
jgi:hypothetical protein